MIPYKSNESVIQTSKYSNISRFQNLWKIGQTNKSTGNLIMNKFSYNSNAIWGHEETCLSSVILSSVLSQS